MKQSDCNYFTLEGKMSSFRPLAGVVEEPDNQHRYFEEAGYVPDSGGYGIAAFRGLALSPARTT